MIHNLRNIFILLGAMLLVGAGLFAYQQTLSRTPSASQMEAGFEEPDVDSSTLSLVHPRLKGIENWQRPSGPFRVALQAGHWKAVEAPDELVNLRTRTGTSGGGVAEWEANLRIAEEARKLLVAAVPDIVVDILPATVPTNYYADALVSIHADGNENRNISGYKVAAPWRDYSELSDELSALIDMEYGNTTSLARDPNITRNMTGYYAFNWRRYEHSMHPKTPAAIVETGFLTNASDRKIIVDKPQVAAQGIVSGVVKFLNEYIK